MDVDVFLLGLAWAAGTVVAVFALTALAAARRGRHDTIDTVWGLGFAAIAVVEVLASIGSGDPARRVLVAVLTVVWGVRLGVHIHRRNARHGEDPRYAELVAAADGHLGSTLLRKVYLPQGVVMWVVALPLSAAMAVTAPVNWVDAVGGLVWLVGFGFEAVGDAQLARFSADPANRGRVLDTGLWRYTRHPNYFGDACVWWGLGILALHSGIAAATLLGPVVMTWFLAKGTGKPMTERRMQGSRPGYADYVARTSGFLPLPPKKGAARG